MVETRVYAATTGRCLAGDTGGMNQHERDKIERDLSSGVRFVVDEVGGEIRGFVPVDRGSREAFFATTSFSEGDPAEITEYFEHVKRIFDSHTRWEIRNDTPEGELFQALAEKVNHSSEAQDSVETIHNDSHENEQIGVPSFTRAAAIIRAHHDPPQPVGGPNAQTSLVSVTTEVDHISPDLFIHVSQEYDSPRVIMDD